MRKTYGHEYPRTLGALMAWSELDPSGPAVTDSAGTLDRRAFQNRVLCVAAGLRRAGVGPGARVALWLPNGAGYLAAIFACARLGALAIHINTRFRMAEVGNLLRRSRPVAMLMEWGFPPVDFPAIFAALPAQDRAALRCVLGLKVSPSVTQLAGLPVLSLEGPAADAGLDEATGETPCLTFTTSGTRRARHRRRPPYRTGCSGCGAARDGTVLRHLRQRRGDGRHCWRRSCRMSRTVRR